MVNVNPISILDIDIKYNEYLKNVEYTKRKNKKIYVDLTTKKFIGYVTGEEDPTGKGRYLVYIPELFRLDSKLQRQWYPNHISKNRWVEFMDPKSMKTYNTGEYIPLSAGMRVFVEFEQNNIRAGRITQVLSRHDKNIPLDNTLYRDFLHMIRKTKENTWLYIDEKKKYLHWSFHNSRTGFTMDENKVSISVAKPIKEGMGGLTHDLTAEFAENGYFCTYKNFRFMFMDDTGIVFNVGEKNKSFIKISEDEIFLKSEGDINLLSGKDINLHAKRKVNLYGEQEINIFSDILKLTGIQQLTGTSNVIDFQATLSASLKGKYTFVDSDDLTMVCSDGTTKICEPTQSTSESSY